MAKSIHTVYNITHITYAATVKQFCKNFDKKVQIFAISAALSYFFWLHNGADLQHYHVHSAYVVFYLVHVLHKAQLFSAHDTMKSSTDLHNWTKSLCSKKCVS